MWVCFCLLLAKESGDESEEDGHSSVSGASSAQNQQNGDAGPNKHSTSRQAAKTKDNGEESSLRCPPAKTQVSCGCV